VSSTAIIQLYVFVLAAFVGYQVITRVPPLLHTPLMSATNAISGISLVGSIVAAGGQYGRVATILGFIAVICAMTNVVGGFLITDRMLRMFKRVAGAKAEGDPAHDGAGKRGDSKPVAGD
jgi:H+-translocating NAD(P) transhydrogenase subunit alpha